MRRRIGLALSSVVVGAAALTLAGRLTHTFPAGISIWGWISADGFDLPSGTGRLALSALTAVLLGVGLGVALGIWMRGRRGLVSRTLRFFGTAAYALPVFLVAPMLARSWTGPLGGAWATGALWSVPLLLALAFRIGDRPRTWSPGAVLGAEGRRSVRLLGEELPVMVGGWIAATLQDHVVSLLALWHLLLLLTLSSSALMALGAPGAEARKVERRVRAEFGERETRPSAL